MVVWLIWLYGCMVDLHLEELNLWQELNTKFAKSTGLHECNSSPIEIAGSKDSMALDVYR